MRNFVAFISFVLLSCITSPGYTLNNSTRTATTDGSRNDVQNAINDSAVTDGWTVNIPNGSFSWSSTVQISGKGITLKGSGPGSVSISGSASPKIDMDKVASSPVVISGMTFSGGSQSIVVGGAWNARPFVIGNCVFNTNGSEAIHVGTNGGLIYGCTFNGTFGYNDQAVKHKIPSDTQSWSTADTMGVKDTSGERNLYVEDCTFNSMPLQGFDFDDASRIVVRYCRFTNAAITSHGQDTSPVGMRHFEIYNNVFDYTFAQSDPNAKDVGYLMYIRGGTGIIADNSIDNVISQQWGNKAEVLLTVFNINRSGQIPCQTRYPAARQVGQSHNGSSTFTDPIYLWGNTGSGNFDSPGLQQYSPDECGNGQRVEDYIKAGRDYITKTVKPGYTKYPYPHPLRSGSGGGGVPAPTATPAATPTPTPAPTATPTPTATPPNAPSSSDATPPSIPTGLPEDNNGIAAQFPNDANIGSHPDVLFVDTFESYSSASQLSGIWNSYYQGSNTRIATESGNKFAGNRALEFTLRQGSSEVANAVVKNISPSEDTLFVRTYTKFDSGFANTREGHNGIRISARYPGPGNQPNGTDFFGFSLENSIYYSEAEPGYTHVYGYYPEQRGQYGDHWYPDGTVIPFDATPGNFGPNFVSRPNFIPERNRWYCYEFMVKANTPGQRDGRVSIWIDGKVIADFRNVRVRDVSNLRIDQIQLELHAKSSVTRENKKWYDNVVVARSYIGPMVSTGPQATPTPAPTPSGGFVNGDRVVALQGVAARNIASTGGTILQIHTAGELGTVTGGPTSADGWTWWNINYDTGSDGWSTQEGYLAKATPAPTPTQSAPAPPTGLRVAP